jgi:hypothetical protein
MPSAFRLRPTEPGTPIPDPKMRLSFPVAATILLLLWPNALSSQLIRGNLLEEETDDPIDLATVELVNERGRVVMGVLTNRAGYFRIEAPEPGKYTLRAQRIGYKTTDTPAMEMLSTDSMEVQFRISQNAVFLAPITVLATQRPWWERIASPVMWGFYDRRDRMARAGGGTFLDREQLEAYDGLPITAFLGTMPGVRVENNEVGSYVILRGGRGLIRTCQPEYFVDGMRLSLRSPDSDDYSNGDVIDTVVSISGLEAIEIYDGASQMPAEFGGMAANCGVVALWTRRS